MIRGSKNIAAGISVIFITALVAGGCLPDPLPVKGIPTVKPQLVVASQIVPDQSLVVVLTRTFGALEASDESDPEELFAQIAVTDALVLLRGPGSVDTLLEFDDGLYGGILLPLAAGEEYTLEITNTQYGTVTATATVMEQRTFEFISANLHYTEFDDTLAQITYSYNDPPGANWYMINVQEVEQEDAVENLLNPGAYTRLIDEQSEFGTLFGEQFEVVPREYRPGDTIAVSLSHISFEYYEFLKLRRDNRFSFIEYLSEPVNYPSNVKGGRGFFNLYIPDVRFFVLEE